MRVYFLGSQMDFRWLRGRQKAMLLFCILFAAVGGVLLYSSQQAFDDVNRTARLKTMLTLRQSLLLDQGSKCNFPSLPVNSSVMMQFIKHVDPLRCTKGGPDWASCNGNLCKVKSDILFKYTSISCQYSDILWESDFLNQLGAPVTVKDGDTYHLRASDFVEVNCEGEDVDAGITDSWTGYLIGIRRDDSIKTRLSWDKLNGEAMRYNVLMFGFDSLSRNTFVRKLPKSHKYLMEVLNGHVLEGYNIVGDGTPQALIPILTGCTELELPDTRRRMGKSAYYVNTYPLIWKKFADNGYATAFYEDTPNVGIFTYRLKGFSPRPTDHYMRSYFVHTESKQSKWSKYCNGDVPRHKLMLNYTRQFMESYADSPRFVFAFHGELSHDDYNLVQAADDDLLEWMRGLKKSGLLDNTIFIMMSDHGHRFASVRNTLQGKQEERLPWFSFVLPQDIRYMRPGALDNFKENTKRLTTPFDIHATFMDILGMNPHENYEIKSKYPPRSLSLFGPISINRTCGQAGIEPHWCACLSWHPIPLESPFVQRLAEELVAAINKYVSPYSDRCAVLTLEKIEWAMSLAPTDGLLTFKKTMDKDGFLPDLSATTADVTNVYQIKVRLMPGSSLFEASLTHIVDDDSVSIKLSDISRINKYGQQARCVYQDQPQLRKYCYCTRD
ncbi:uncharacterized protein LOC143917050 isoform X2 [Arctopsyche grandis]|uniref:uncharacterized protein LOC143917050 isoform X2 n=1 Tax=Arctopsyche grandis TaxID=121162 RepID=UPI00406DA01D